MSENLEESFVPPYYLTPEEIEAREDEQDIKAYELAMANSEGTITLDELRKQLGL